MTGRGLGLVAVTADCTGCGACLLTCPEHAFRPVARPGAAAGLAVLEARCTGCLECVEICPADAIVEVPAPPAVGPHVTGRPVWCESSPRGSGAGAPR